MKARRRRNFFYKICHSRKHTINEIMSESKIQELRKPAAGEFFFTEFVTVCTQIMNEIVNEIEIQERESPPHAKFLLQHVSQSQTYN